MLYADVIVKKMTPANTLTYAVPASIVPYIKVGSAVSVKLRRSICEAVVVKIKRNLPSELKETRINELISIDRDSTYSTNQLLTNETLANQTQLSLSEIAGVALNFPSNQAIENEPNKKINVVIAAGLFERFKYYANICHKHQDARIVIVCSFIAHAQALSKYLIENKLNIYSAIGSDSLNSRKALLAVANSRIVVTTIAGAFLPLKPTDIYIVDSIDQAGSSMLRRPYLSLEQISVARSSCEKVQLVQGVTLPTAKLARQIVNKECKLVTGALTGETVISKKAFELNEQLSSNDRSATRLKLFEPDEQSVNSSAVTTAVTYEQLIVVDADFYLSRTIFERQKAMSLLRELIQRSKTTTILTSKVEHPFWSALTQPLSVLSLTTQLTQLKKLALPPFLPSARMIGDFAPIQFEAELQKAKDILETFECDYGEIRTLRASARQRTVEIPFVLNKTDIVSELRQAIGFDWQLVLD